MVGLRFLFEANNPTSMSEYHKHTSAEILKFIGELIDPYTQQPLQKNNAITRSEITPSGISIDIVRPYPVGYAEAIITELILSALSEKLTQPTNNIELHLQLEQSITPYSQQHAVKGIDGLANIIAVASGKGGVGKSTISANLALALAEQGASVGILDADIYGPSQPGIFSVFDKPDMVDNKMIPLNNYGIQIMSIGLMVGQETPMIWRGPMVTQALEQMLRQTAWSELDYLILDLPPGTGDVQLTLAQKIPLAGAVVVTTPQDLALYDVRKAIKMFEKVKVPILGVIENMSSHICANCQHEEAIFGQGGGETLAAEYDLPLLGKIPLDIRIRQAIDQGKPTVALAKANEAISRDLEIAQRYHETALRMAAKLSSRKKDYKSLFPNIEISNT